MALIRSSMKRPSSCAWGRELQRPGPDNNPLPGARRPEETHIARVAGHLAKRSGQRVLWPELHDGSYPLGRRVTSDRLGSVVRRSWGHLGGISPRAHVPLGHRQALRAARQSRRDLLQGGLALRCPRAIEGTCLVGPLHSQAPTDVSVTTL